MNWWNWVARMMLAGTPLSRTSASCATLPALYPLPMPGRPTPTMDNTT